MTDPSTAALQKRRGPGLFVSLRDRRGGGAGRRRWHGGHQQGRQRGDEPRPVHAGDHPPASALRGLRDLRLHQRPRVDQPGAGHGHGPGGQSIPVTELGSSNTTLSRGTTSYVAQVGFHISSSGDYLVHVGGPRGVPFILSNSLSDLARHVAAWFGLLVLGVLLAVVGGRAADRRDRAPSPPGAAGPAVHLPGCGRPAAAWVVSRPLRLRRQPLVGRDPLDRSDQRSISSREGSSNRSTAAELQPCSSPPFTAHVRGASPWPNPPS